MGFLSPHNRVLGTIGGLGLAAALSIGLTFVHIQAQDEALGERFASQGELSGLVFQLAGAIRDNETAALAYLLTGDSDALSRYRAATADETEISAQIADVASEMPGVLSALAALNAATATWHAAIETTLATVQDGPDSAVQLDPGYAREFDSTRAAVEQLAAESDAVAEALDVTNEALTEARTTTTIAGLGVTVLAAVISLWFVRRYGRALEGDVRRSDVMNRFTEVTTFAADDRAVADANLAALVLLAHPNAAVTHILNPSLDRAVPEATRGDARAEVLPLKALSGCPGIVRGSIYVTPDATAPLSVHCPVYPVDRGTLACVPLAHGETVGSVHLHWDAADAFPLDLRASVARVAEHAALAIGNRRLLALLEGQASTDARTGLPNSRTFDRALEQELAAREDDDRLAVLMLDLDHFKDFNDRHGHPAGDEALRVFAGVLRSCMRGDDVAARYGGEEFAVLLPGVDEAAAQLIADRIRSRTESTIIPLGPGISERITVSIGVAMAPEHAADRVSLLRAADAALYQAKGAGRNQVRFPRPPDAPPSEPTPRPGRPPELRPERSMADGPMWPEDSAA